MNPQYHKVEAVERETRGKYSREMMPGYRADTVSRKPVEGSDDYFNQLLKIRLHMAELHACGGRILDVGCATGEHLFELASEVRSGIGIDFSFPFLKRAMETRAAKGGGKFFFVEGNARRMPFRSDSFDFIYSLSALYYMPNIEEVIGEIARVLARGGRCLLEMGNSWSLNACVARAYPELAKSFHLRVSRMKRILRHEGLRIAGHRAFQILPFWGERPHRIGFFLRPFWKRCFERRVGNRMIDEWLCEAPMVRNFAFRHVFICVKNR